MSAVPRNQYLETIQLSQLSHVSVCTRQLVVIGGHPMKYLLKHFLPVEALLSALNIALLSLLPFMYNTIIHT